MKKLLFLILFMFLFACKKDETFCWNCRRDIFTPGANYSVVIEVCGQSESEIKEFERDNTSLNGTTTIKMSCWKKGDPPKI
jgi:hypothetical protein